MKVKLTRNNKNAQTVKETRKLTIYKIDSAKYKFEDETANKSVNKMINGVKLLEYVYTYMNKDPKVLKKVLKRFDYESMIDLYCNESKGKLRAFGIFKALNIYVPKLYRILVYIMIDQNMKINNINLPEIKERIDYFQDEHPILKRMFAIKDGQVINIDDNIQPSDDLKNSMIMVEYSSGRFLSVPYYNYKKLFEIESIIVTYKINLIDANNYNEPYSYHMSLDAWSTKSILDVIMTYENLWIALEAYNTAINVEQETVKITFKNGKNTKVNYEDFISEYVPFIRI